MFGFDLIGFKVKKTVDKMYVDEMFVDKLACFNKKLKSESARFKSHN